MSKNSMDARIRWKCRRGMLELDLLFLLFLEKNYKTLSTKQRKVFERLLDQEDRDLQAWFFRQAEPKDTELKAMVTLISDAEFPH